MGITAVVSGAAPNGISLPVPVGTGVGSLFAAVALIFLLGYFDLFTAASIKDRRQRKILLGAIVPLLVVFAAVVLFQAMRVLNSSG